MSGSGNSDRKIKEMAELLKEGATMLSYICPDCKVPLFRLKNGIIICPSCKRRVILSIETDLKGEALERGITNKFEFKIYVENLKEKIYNKINMMLEEINDINDPNKINNILSIIERLIRILKELQ
ncbi:MAG: hypothetical protein NDF57_02515 [archaeon GBS-70-058]|nr:hypothetical protein [Candidatus Culexarchaeum nevadense]